MIQPSCYASEYPIIKFTLYKNDMSFKIVEKTFTEDFQPQMVLEANYAAGDKFLIDVQVDWYGIDEESDRYPVPDYTLKIYSKQTLVIKDSDGQSNMWHMDG